MRALYYTGPRSLEWRDDPEPRIEAVSDAIVRPVAVTTCDLDQALINGLDRELSDTGFPGADQPFALGHEGVAEVVEVGSGVTSVGPGDLVVVPYHISCGACDRCHRDLSMYCRESAASAVAVFGLPAGDDYGGLFSELVRVPFADANLVKLPPNVTPQQAASVSDNLTDAWKGVGAFLQQRPGADVLVISGGSIGLYAVDIAIACGARHVQHVDDDPGRRATAAKLGAETCALAELDPFARDYELTFNAMPAPEALRAALLATAPGGHCENSAFYLEDVALPMFALHLKSIEFRASLSPARVHTPAVLELLSSGRLHPELVTTAVLPFAEADTGLLDGGFKPVFVRD